VALRIGGIDGAVAGGVLGLPLPGWRRRGFGFARRCGARDLSAA
jgi:hypothetical protein